MPSRARVGANGRLRSAPARTHPRKDCGHARSLRKDGACYRGLAWHRTRQPVCSCQGRSTTRRSLRPRQEAEAVVAEIRNAGGRADTVGADLAAADGAHTLAKRVRGIIDDRAIRSSKAMTRPKVGGGVTSTRSCSISAIAPRRTTVRSRATIETAAQPPHPQLCPGKRLAHVRIDTPIIDNQSAHDRRRHLQSKLAGTRRRSLDEKSRRCLSSAGGTDAGPGVQASGQGTARSRPAQRPTASPRLRL